MLIINTLHTGSLLVIHRVVVHRYGRFRLDNVWRKWCWSRAVPQGKLIACLLMPRVHLEYSQLNLRVRPLQYYGHWDEKSRSYQITAAWQAGFSQASNCGAIVGIFISGWLIDRFGYKKTLVAGYILIIPLIGGCFWSSEARYTDTMIQALSRGPKTRLCY